MAVSSHGRVPRARHDPIQSIDTALALFSAQISRPLRAETLAMFLDEHDCGSTLVTVTDTEDPFAVVDVADAMSLAGGSSPEVCGLVLATVRPGGGPEPGDDDLWLEASDVVAENGLVLVDWFVIGRHGTFSPRELLGMPSRWPCSR
ncbi:MAG: hypothetical protein JWM34_827 [Ilumatobacteraceae bacterium]|nr:hypothetical protein [Ilumatobacteraceae bacterium]